MESNEMKLELANAVSEILWMKGLLTKEELLKVKEKNREAIMQKKLI